MRTVPARGGVNENDTGDCDCSSIGEGESAASAGVGGVAIGDAVRGRAPRRPRRVPRPYGSASRVRSPTRGPLPERLSRSVTRAFPVASAFAGRAVCGRAFAVASTQPSTSRRLLAPVTPSLSPASPPSSSSSPETLVSRSTSAPSPRADRRAVTLATTASPPGASSRRSSPSRSNPPSAEPRSSVFAESRARTGSASFAFESSEGSEALSVCAANAVSAAVSASFQTSRFDSKRSHSVSSTNEDSTKVRSSAVRFSFASRAKRPAAPDSRTRNASASFASSFASSRFVFRKNLRASSSSSVPVFLSSRYLSVFSRTCSRVFRVSTAHLPLGLGGKRRRARTEVSSSEEEDSAWSDVASEREGEGEMFSSSSVTSICSPRASCRCARTSLFERASSTRSARSAASSNAASAAASSSAVAEENGVRRSASRSQSRSVRSETSSPRRSCWLRPALDLKSSGFGERRPGGSGPPNPSASVSASDPVVVKNTGTSTSDPSLESSPSAMVGTSARVAPKSASRSRRMESETTENPEGRSCGSAPMATRDTPKACGLRRARSEVTSRDWCAQKVDSRLTATTSFPKFDCFRLAKNEHVPK